MMLLADRLAEVPSASGQQPSLQLRLNDGTDTGRVLDLRTGRVSVGSAKRCEVCLDQAGVQPVHCLLIHESGNWIARPWSPDTRLNGEPFQQAQLTAGDVISVGLVDLEVIAEGSIGGQRSETQSSGNQAAHQAAPNIPAETTRPPHDGRTLPPSAPQDDLLSSRPALAAAGHPLLPVSASLAEDEVVPQLRSRCAAARLRSRKLLATLRRDRDANRQLEEQLAGLKQQHQVASKARQAAASELHRASIQLADAEHQAAEYTSLADSHRRLTERAAAIHAEKARLADRVDQLTAQMTQWSTAKREFEDENAALREKCQRLTEQYKGECAKAGRLAAKQAELANEQEHLTGRVAELEQHLAKSTAALTEANAKLSELDDNYRSVSSERDQLEERVSQLNAELSNSAGQTQVLTDECDRLRREVGEIRTECDRATQSAQALTTERDQLREHSAQAASEVARLTGEITSQAELHQSVERERDQLLRDVEILQQEVARIPELEQRSAEERRALQEECRDLQSVVAGLNEKLTQADAARAEILEEKKSLQHEIDRLREEHTQVWDKVAQLKDENARIDQQLTELADENSNLITERDRLQEQVETRSHEADSWVERENTLVDENRRITQDLEQAQAELDRLRNEAAEARESQERLANEKEALVGERDDLRAEAERMQQEACQAADDLGRESERANSLEQDCDRLRQEQTQVWDKVAHLSEENTTLVQASSQFEEQFTELTAECENVRSQFVQLRDEVEKLRSAESALLDTNRALTASSEQAEAETQRLRGENSELDAERNRLVGENATLVDARGEIQQELERLKHEVERQSERTARLITENQDLHAACDELRRERAQMTEGISTLSKDNAALTDQLAATAELGRELELARSREQELAKRLAEVEQQLADLQRQRAELAAEVREFEQLSDTWASSEATHDELLSPTPTEPDERLDPESESGAATASQAISVPAGFQAAEANDVPQLGWPDACRENAHGAQQAVSPAWPTSNSPAVEESAPQSAPATSPQSYIDQFAHVFEEDPHDAQILEAPPSASTSAEPKSQLDCLVQPSEGEQLGGDEQEEESIEQYMAKLMQRVRGGDTRATESHVSLAPAAIGPDNTATHEQETTPSLPQSPPPGDEVSSSSDANGTCHTSNPTELTRHSPAPEQASDLKALRELANESARRAIGVYATRTHRRSALTKFIVSMLAGVTGLWLMLSVPHWQDLQFIIACFLLVVAAYWAGQTLQTLINAIRAGRYGEPEEEPAETDEPADPTLPIDVEEGRW